MMTTISPEQLIPSKISSQLTIYHQRQFTGKLNVQAPTGKCWVLYLSWGRLMWATGGIHPARRWRRQLARHCPHINPRALRLRQTDKSVCWDYEILTLLAQRQIISQEQIIAVVEGTITEVLFDILQTEVLFDIIQSIDGSPDTSIFDEKQPINGLEIKRQLLVHPCRNTRLPPTWMISVDTALSQAQQVWKHWVDAGLQSCSPDLAPRLNNRSQLERVTSASAYRNLDALINGRRTLRDVAMLMRQDLVKLTRYLRPYINQQLISLVRIPDFNLPGVANSTVCKNPNFTAVNSKSPLVACIDDSPQTCQMMEELLANGGYRSLTIQDAIKALPILLKYKPDLIFLDLIMPIANGYEVCSQIRRISRFQDTPVVILTASDGFVDRMRAKIVGATDFLTKPVDTKRVLTIIRNHCFKA